MITFNELIKQGKIGETIFKEDFLDYLNISYEDVTGSQAFQIIDSDFLSLVGTIEVKTSYKDNKQLIFEEYTNVNPNLGKVSLGWMHKTKAKLIVFVSKVSRTLIFLPLNDSFKEYYNKIKNNFKLIKNQFSSSGYNKWQSAFIIIPFSKLSGYISVYKKI